MPDRDPLIPRQVAVMTERVTRCIQCGKELPRSRSDRRFCSNACAARFAKWRHGLVAREMKIKSILAQIAEYGNYPQFLDAGATMSNLYRSVDYWTKIIEKRQSEKLRALDAEAQ